MPQVWAQGLTQASRVGFPIRQNFCRDKISTLGGKCFENWADVISVGASKGEEKHYKTVFATLGRHLYDRALPLAQQCIFDHAQESKLIDYKQDDQVAVLWEIVDLIASIPLSSSSLD